MYQPLKLKPGIDVEQSPLLNSAGWSFSAGIRFREGLPEKRGGFAALNSVALNGIATGMHAWADLASNLYIAAGTDQMLELFLGGSLFDITPLRATDNVAVAFSTTASSKTVQIKDTANGASAGDWVDVNVPVSVGGIVVQGDYRIQTIVDADNYTITAANAATSPVTDGGAVPSFTTDGSTATVSVDLANHGYSDGDNFEVQVSTTGGGVTLFGAYAVTVVDANHFTIQAGTVSTSVATFSENGGNAQLQYLIPTGPQSATLVGTGGGYGVGAYGGGAYGVATGGTVTVPLRQWFLDNFGEDLIGNYAGSPLYLWVPPYTYNNRAVAIDTTNFPSAADPPKQCAFSFVAWQQQMVIAGGCNTPGTSTLDPLILRWCNQDDYTDWTATVTNQAGSYRIPVGSRLVGGIAAPNFNAIWTDVGLWLMTYLGGTGLSELVWGFNEVAGASGLLSARARGVYKNLVFYLSSNGMYAFDGSRINLVPCTVWDKFWKNLNRQQVDKVNMQVNSYFQELQISFPSAKGNGTVDSLITYNIREGSWTYDDNPTQYARTSWLDENVYGSPMGSDLSGYIQQQDSEGVYDANGAALTPSVRTGWFSIKEGSLVGFMERLEADLITGSPTDVVQVTVFAKDYAAETAAYPIRTYGPYTWQFGSGPPWALVRARGRFFSIQISSNTVGCFWRLGDLRYSIQQAGRRP